MNALKLDELMASIVGFIFFAFIYTCTSFSSSGAYTDKFHIRPEYGAQSQVALWLQNRIFKPANGKASIWIGG